MLTICCGSIQAETYELPFVEAGGLILVEASIADVSGYFIFDSGSNSVIVHRRESISKSDATFHTLAGPLEAALLPNRNLQMGDYLQQIEEAYGADLSYLNEMMSTDIKVMGILGGHVFTPHAITIDNREQVIKVETASKKPPAHTTQLPLDTSHDFPMTTIHIDGKAYNFVIDSGAKSHHISPDVLLAHSTRYQLLGDQVNVFTATGGKLSCNSARISNVDLGTKTTTLTALVTDFTATSEAVGIKIDGILSLEAINSESITIDLDRGLLYF
jgi:hypothetical protein